MIRRTRCHPAHLAGALLVAALTAAPVARADDARTAPARPNVVFILADDLGWTDLACFGSGYYRTPNLDRMAAQGMKFTDGYSCGPNCQPTRAALMSGQYGPRTGVYTVGSRDRFDWRSRSLEPPENVTKLAPAVVTVAEALKAAGYATGMFGKWHLGEDPEHHPAAQGFDEAIVSMGRHFDFKTNPKVDVPEGAYLADFLTDRALDFLDRHRDGPFFLYVPHYGVHSPYEARAELIAQFRDRPPAGGHDSPVYAAMIASVDESVGRILAKLDELGLSENTLVIFSSDNGGVGGYERAGLAGVKGITDNAPLRSGKGSLYEGGVRVPWIARWTGRIAPGAVCREPILSVDLYPTLLDLADAPAPEGQPLDGVSLLPLATGAADHLDREAIFWHFPGYLGAGKGQWRTTPGGRVRSGDFVLQEYYEDGRLELYNLADDIGQDHNLAERMPGKARELRGRLAAWRQSVGAVMPEPRTPDRGAAKKAQARGAAKKARGAAKKAQAPRERARP